MTCAIREGAEGKIWSRLDYFRSMKRKRKKDSIKVAVLGCMAERLKESLLSSGKQVDIVVGPDAYRDLPRLLSVVETGQLAANVQLSMDETYADITPVRFNSNNVSAYVSIMRGCDNMCSYCIVPFTRGRERSRPMTSILEEVRNLSADGVKEVTLLGQNVNSYRDLNERSNFFEDKAPTKNSSEDFKTIYKTKKGGARFADLLDAVSLVDPDMRIRFTSPHPKDFPEELIELISTRDNICNHIHLPAQSGNSEVLQRMRRGYSREAYLTLAAHLRQMLPGVHISSDFITGFCGETEDEHTDTLTLMAQVKYEQAFLFAYSMREKTHAHRRFKDDVAEDVKQRRLREIIDVFRSGSLARNEQLVGTTQLVLVDSIGRKPGQFLGRTDGFTRVIMSDVKVPSDTTGVSNTQIEVGDYVAVHITEANAQTLRATPLRVTNIVTHAARAKSKALGDASSDCDSDSSALSG